ncbi:TPA: hypothetical protein I7730_24700 [Vibrio vulnificus]|uniref:Uncharacterized protein n=1 Tax=Vibrio vulnificus TaxID=672 RepID=A0A8H9N504_VIBVL|nr:MULTISPECIES: hypothetical protein [Vibrio]ELI0351406.1 hypothetical protein [Vibrio vulnificus]MCA3912641.1 hypothetical protein [Vibrio vulnificus]MCU8225617.1 hypothetical protein [Vibrio vulnificus]HAS8542961.1 hypothetical protein [Vibrio vulnificus]
MTNQTLKQLAPPKEQIELRVELKLTPHKNYYHRSKRSRTVIQGMPHRVALIVTNLSTKSFKGAALKSVEFKFLGTDITQTVTNELQIPAINPKGKIKIDVTICTFDLHGGGWFSFDLVPESESQDIQCFQYDLAHEQDEPVSCLNHWGMSFYIEGKLAALQTQTNHYILALTVITVLEAIFGIKNILVYLALQLAKFFGLLSSIFSWLGN